MKSLEWVQVFVYQPPFTAQKDIANYEDRKNETWDISLWQQDLIVDIAFQTNKTSRTARWTPRRSRSPARTRGLPALVKTQFHVMAADTAMERHPESSLQGGALCERHNIAPEASSDKENYRALEASLRMWDKPQAAIDRNAYQCDPADKHPFGPPVAVTPSLGTGQTCMSNIQIDWVLDFQMGDVNVGLQSDYGGASYMQRPVEGCATNCCRRRSTSPSKARRSSRGSEPRRTAWSGVDHHSRRRRRRQARRTAVLFSLTTFRTFLTRVKF
ncbi:hypothetical protein [Lentzea terrae]|uniref:hypothetical protein n=1 Tax=Lentzea terrae TaxID=2200761 RepID=UPI000DD3508A|nr:hypothetical protein [Lentzea terrae]